MDKILCISCREQVNANYNYCPHCGEPLNELARQKEQIKMQNAGLLKLHELSMSTKDPAVLKAIKNLIQK